MKTDTLTEKQKWELNETSYAVQIAKKHIGSIEILCEVPIYPFSEIENVRNLAKSICHKLNTYYEIKLKNDALLSALKGFIKLEEFLGNTGDSVMGKHIQFSKDLIQKAEQ